MVPASILDSTADQLYHRFGVPEGPARSAPTTPDTSSADTNSPPERFENRGAVGKSPDPGGGQTGT
jgi:hypothetical protein